MELETVRRIKEKKLRSRQRAMENRCYQALRGEAFLVALWPTAAIAVLAVGVVLWLWRWKRDPDVHFRRLPYDMPLFIFILIGAASVAVSPDPAFSLYNYCYLIGAYIFTYFLAGQTLRTEEQLGGVLRAMAWSAVLVVLYGFYQFSFGIDVSDMKWVDGEAFPELKRRVFSTWENPNILAGYLGEAAAVVFAFLMGAERAGERQKWGVFLAALLACLAMTYARGAFLSIALVLAGYGALRDRRVLLGCAACVALALFIDPMLAERITSVFTKVDTSSEMRLAIWESTLAMIFDHPLLGIGWGAYWMVYPEYDFYINDVSVRIFHAHNMFLNYAAEVGVVGLLAFLWYFFGTMVSAFLTSASHASSLVRRFELGVGLALVSVALGGLTDDVVFNIPTSMLLWMGCALAMAAAEIVPEAARRDEETQEELGAEDQGRPEPQASKADGPDTRGTEGKGADGPIARPTEGKGADGPEAACPRSPEAPGGEAAGTSPAAPPQAKKTTEEKSSDGLAKNLQKEPERSA